MQYLEELEKRLQALEQVSNLPNVDKEIDLLLLRNDWDYRELYNRFNKNNANRRGFSLLQILEAGKQKGLWKIPVFKSNGKSYRSKKDMVLDLLEYLNSRK